MNLPDGVTEEQFANLSAVMGSSMAAMDAITAFLRPTMEELFHRIVWFNALFMPDRPQHRIRRRRPKFGMANVSR